MAAPSRSEPTDVKDTTTRCGFIPTSRPASPNKKSVDSAANEQPRPKSPAPKENKKKADEPSVTISETKEEQRPTSPEKKEQRPKSPAPAKKDDKVEDAVAAAKACIPFCKPEPPPPVEKKRIGHPCERKEELNKGAVDKSIVKDEHCGNKKQKLSKEDKAKLELKKRQEKPISFLDCVICHKLLRLAVEIDCGHSFCCSCLRKKMRRSKLCPICQTEIEYVHPSYVLRELVDKFGVKDGPKKLKAELLQVSGYYDEYTTEDPIVIASQYVPDANGGCCTCGTSGAFDPADLYKIARLDEYVSVEEYLDTIKMVNQILASWRTGAVKACFSAMCFCFSSTTQNAVNMIEVVLGDCNLKWPETGLFWTLMHLASDTRKARSLGDKFYLILRIDPSRARSYQNTLRCGGQKKDVEMARLRKQNALMRHKMLELGENNFVRALAGRKSPRYSLKCGASLSFTYEYPDFPVISPHTLRDLVLHNPASKRYFLAPWNRVRSTSTGPLPLTREEDCRMRSQLSQIASRSPSPYVDRTTRSISPVTRPKTAITTTSTTSDRLKPWR